MGKSTRTVYFLSLSYKRNFTFIINWTKTKHPIAIKKKQEKKQDLSTVPSISVLIYKTM